MQCPPKLTLWKIHQKLGIDQYEECTDFVVSLLEDIELELEQVFIAKLTIFCSVLC